MPDGGVQPHRPWHKSQSYSGSYGGAPHRSRPTTRLTEHLCGQAVSEHVGTLVGGIHAGLLNGTPDQRRDGAGIFEPADGSFVADEHSSARALGRSLRRYSAIASPTSAGSGNRDPRPPFPRTVIVALSQSISSRLRWMTSQARRPKRANSRRMARSRLPTAVCRSHPSMIFAQSGGKKLRQTRKRPGRHGRHTTCQVGLDLPLEPQVAKKGPQRRYEILARTQLDCGAFRCRKPVTSDARS